MTPLALSYNSNGNNNNSFINVKDLHAHNNVNGYVIEDRQSYTTTIENPRHYLTNMMAPLLVNESTIHAHNSSHSNTNVDGSSIDDNDEAIASDGDDEIMERKEDINKFYQPDLEPQQQQQQSPENK